MSPDLQSSCIVQTAPSHWLPPAQLSPSRADEIGVKPNAWNVLGTTRGRSKLSIECDGIVSSIVHCCVLFQLLLHMLNIVFLFLSLLPLNHFRQAADLHSFNWLLVRFLWQCWVCALPDSSAPSSVFTAQGLSLRLLFLTVLVQVLQSEMDPSGPLLSCRVFRHCPRC